MGKFFQHQRERRVEERIQRLGSELVNLRWEVLALDLEQTLTAVDACMSMYLNETLAVRRPATAVVKATRPKAPALPNVEHRRLTSPPAHAQAQTPRILAC